MKIVLKSLIFLYTLIGKVIDVLAIKSNNNLHPKHRLMRYYEFFLDNIRPGSTILDIGCGNGFVASQIAEKARGVVGIDTEKANISLARKNYSKENIQYIIGNATTYPFRERYDAVVLSNVLEHIRDRIPFLKSINKLSDTLLIRVPMLDRDWLPLYKKELGMFYFCDSTHFTEYTEKSFRAEMFEAGFEVQNLTIRFGEIWAVIRTQQT